MDMEFHTFYSFMLWTKNQAYLLMPVALAVYIGWFMFICGKDEKNGNGHH